MRKIPYLVLILLLAVFYSFSPWAETEKINWLTFEEAVSKAEKKGKPLFIDVYTSWCGWCKVMDRNTFTDPGIIKELNKNFYAVKFNAETRDTINYHGKQFVFVAAGRRGYNQLAAALMNNRMAYPTVVFLVDNLTKVYPHPGYQKVPKLGSLLSYYGGNYHQKMDYATFQQNNKK